MAITSLSRRLAPLVAAAALAGLAGCGDDDTPNADDIQQQIDEAQEKLDEAPEKLQQGLDEAQEQLEKVEQGRGE